MPTTTELGTQFDGYDARQYVIRTTQAPLQETDTILLEGMAGATVTGTAVGVGDATGVTASAYGSAGSSVGFGPAAGASTTSGEVITPSLTLLL